MKTCCQCLYCAFLAAGLLLSCSKTKEEEPTSGDSFATLDAMLDKAGERQKLWVDIAPIELPDYITESEDSMKQKIVALAALIDSSRERAIFPAFAQSAHKSESTRKGTSEGYESMHLSSDEDWHGECFLEDTPNWFCRFTKWENDGKLKIVFTQQNSPEAWVNHYVLDGEHSNGVDYDGFMIQYWLTLKDLTYSEYSY